MTNALQIGECHCCGYETDLISYPSRRLGHEIRLCKLCGASMGGVSYEYNHPDLRIHQTICYVGNAVLAVIEDRERLREWVARLEREQSEHVSLLAGWLAAAGPFDVTTAEDFERMRKRTEDIVCELRPPLDAPTLRDEDDPRRTVYGVPAPKVTR